MPLHAFHKALTDPESPLHKSIAWKQGVAIIGSQVHFKTANTASNLHAFAETVASHFKERDEIEVKSHSPASRVFKLPNNVFASVRIKSRHPQSVLGDLVLEFDNLEQAERFVKGLAQKLAASKIELATRKAFAKPRRGVDSKPLSTGLRPLEKQW